MPEGALGGRPIGRRSLVSDRCQNPAFKNFLKNSEQTRVDWRQHHLDFYSMSFASVHRWLVDSPLWVTFVIAPLFSAFLLWVALALWSFVRIKPQQLNLWVLK